MNIKKGFPGHSLSKHYVLQHNKDPSNLKVIGIDRYEPHWRGGNGIRGVSHPETKKIFDLCTIWVYYRVGLELFI